MVFIYLKQIKKFVKINFLSAHLQFLEYFKLYDDYLCRYKTSEIRQV